MEPALGRTGRDGCVCLATATLYVCRPQANLEAAQSAMAAADACAGAHTSGESVDAELVEARAATAAAESAAEEATVQAAELLDLNTQVGVSTVHNEADPRSTQGHSSRLAPS